MATYTQRISANANGYFHSNLPTWNTTLMLAGVDGSSNWWHAALLFTSVPILQAATINSATIDLEAHSLNTVGGGSAVALKISAVDEDDAAVATNITECATDDGIRTTAKIDWDYTIATSGTDTTPDLKTIIQEIVDREGWVSGNAILIHIDDDGSSASRRPAWDDYENAPSTAPIITIDYEGDFGGFWGLRVA